MRHRGPISPMLAKVHPITGEEIRPVGYLPNGRAVWPIMGGAPDDDDDDDDDDDAENDDDDDTDSGGAGKKKVKKSKADSDADEDDDTEDDDREALRRRMMAADKRAAAAEKRLKAIEDAEKGDLEKAQERVAEFESEIKEKDSVIRTLRLQNSFLTANKHAWHDPDDALDVAERKGYIEDVMDDDGNVDKKRLSSALDRLAKEKPYLVQKPAKDDDDEDRGPSGEPSSRRSDNSKDDRARKEQLKKRFPVLNR